VLENDAHFWAALLFLGLCHVATGHAEAALDALRSAVEYSGDTSMAVAALGHAFGRFGRRQEAEQLLSRLESRSATEYIPPFWLALVWCGLGERDEALRQLELASQERSPALPFWLGCEPRLDPLRNDARFQQLLQRVGLIDPQ
jgi:Flp pilus assembly protein TadD